MAIKLKTDLSLATIEINSGQGWGKAVNQEMLPNQSFKIQDKIRTLQAYEAYDNLYKPKELLKGKWTQREGMQFKKYNEHKSWFKILVKF